MLTHRKKKKNKEFFLFCNLRKKTNKTKLKLPKKQPFLKPKKLEHHHLQPKRKNISLFFFSYIYVLTWEWTKIFFGCSNPFAKSFFFASNIKETFEKETKKKLSKVKSASLSSRENANAHDFQEERRHFKC